MYTQSVKLHDTICLACYTICHFFSVFVFLNFISAYVVLKSHGHVYVHKIHQHFHAGTFPNSYNCAKVSPCYVPLYIYLFLFKTFM